MKILESFLEIKESTRTPRISRTYTDLFKYLSVKFRVIRARSVRV